MRLWRRRACACLFAKKPRASARGRAPIRRQIALPRRGTENLRSLRSALPAVRGLAKLEPLSRRRPLSSIEAGGVEARWRYAHRPSTRAGPFDAVIDVVRSRRL